MYRTAYRVLPNATRTLSVNSLNAPKHRLYWSGFICRYKAPVKYTSCQPLLLRDNYQVISRNSSCIIGYPEGSLWNTIKIIPETNLVPSSVAATLLLLFMMLISLVSVLNLLYFYNSTFRSMCAVPNMAVFCSSLNSWFSGMLLTYSLNDFEWSQSPILLQVLPWFSTFHMRRILLLLLLLFVTVSKLFSFSSMILTLHPIGLALFSSPVCCLSTRKLIPLHNAWSDQSV